MCQVHMIQLPCNVCLMCARFSWQYDASLHRAQYDVSLHPDFSNNMMRLCTVCVSAPFRDNMMRLCTVCQAFATQLPWNVCVPCARFTWQYYLYNVLLPCARFASHNCPKTSLCLVLDSRYNISPKTSFYRVQGLHHTNALKRLCTVCQVYVAQLS